jgi:ribosomal-protein-alanine N-acetyltransferase
VTPDELARIHGVAFIMERSWTASEFSDLLSQQHTHLIAQLGGFALTRTVAGESELLTLAVDPAQQRRGIASNLLSDWLAHATATADTAFLEVAADNSAALALYHRMSFTQSGLRKAYYSRAEGVTADAIVMTRALNTPLTQG